MQGEQNQLRQRRSRRLPITYVPKSLSPSSRNSSGAFLPMSVGYAFIAFFLISTKFLHVFENTLPNQIKIEDADKHLNRFIGERAELQLKRLTSLGTRVVGSYENEILAIDFLKREVAFIEQEASKIHKIEIDIQKPTGSYYLMFKPHGFRNYYANIQNFVVKLSSGDSPHSILLNCHYDTVPESPGASDNGLNCAVMLEILRVLATGSTPLKNNVIFLFNGAEENPLQASHGFATQQKWSKEIKTVINLDSCGAGGRETLFQTTGEPWLLEVYTRAVPRPSAGVQAEELFLYGIIPSDTDFRNFRDFGNYPGYDIAHYANGYVYHTKYDSVDFICPGVYQNTGDNLLSLVRELASSSEIEGPHPRTRIVYFDVFTMHMVAYTETFGVTLNLVSSLICLLAVYGSQKRSSGGCQSLLEKLTVATGGQVFGLMLAGVAVFTVAQILDFCKVTMSWYLRPWLVFPLYGFPIVIAQMLALKITEKYLEMDFLRHKAILFINGGQILLTIVLLLGTLAGIRSSFILMFFVLFPAVGSLFVTIFKRCYSVKTFLIAHLTCMAFPLLFTLSQTVRVFMTIIPMTARMGPHKNPETIIGTLALLLSAAHLSLLVPCLLFIRRLKTFLFSVFLLHTLAMTLVLKTNFGFPYDGNPQNPAPQRFYVLHCERTFHDGRGLVRESDSGIFVQSLDRNDIKYVSQFLPELQNSPTAADYCSTEMFCGFPVFTSRFIKPAPYSHWIQAAPPTVHHPTSFEVVNQTQILVNTRRIRILVTGPDHITVGLSPRVGVELVRWSFDKNTPVVLSSWNGRKIYMVYYSHGLVGGTLEFDVDLEVTQNHLDYMMDVAVVGHYMHDKKFRTYEFQNFLSKFPQWAHLTPWTTTFKSWVI